MAAKPISVLLVDDHAMVRDALAMVVTAEKDMRVVGQAADGREGIEKAAKLKPDVITIDLAMPNLNGIEAVRHIKRASPEVKVLVVSGHEEDLYIEHALEAGVDGFLSKNAAADTLARAIRDVKAGKKVFSPAVLQRLAQYEKGAGDGQLHRKQTAKLSERETEVLQLIAEGHPNKAIAADLGISMKTVEKHRAHLMTKLNIHDTAGLTRYAIFLGLVESPIDTGLPPPRR